MSDTSPMSMCLEFDDVEDERNEDAQNVLPFADLLPTFEYFGGQYFDRRAFRLIYDTEEKRDHFAITKQPLPVEWILVDEQFLHAMDIREPEPIVDHAYLALKMRQLRPTYGRDYAAYFRTADEFVSARSSALHDAAQFLGYDIYCYMVAPHVVKSSPDPQLAQMFPCFWETVTDEATGKSIIHVHVENHDRWVRFRNEAYNSAVEFAKIKSSDDTLVAIREILALEAVDDVDVKQESDSEEYVKIKQESPD